MKRIFTRADLVLVLVLIFLILGFLFLRGKEEGKTVALRVDGKTVAELDLSADGEYLVENEYGTNRVSIRNGQVSVTEADCPNRDCMRGRISRSGESLACLPHHLLIVVEGEGEVDAVSGK